MATCATTEDGRHLFPSCSRCSLRERRDLHRTPKHARRCVEGRSECIAKKECVLKTNKIKGRNNKMKLPLSHPEHAAVPTALKFQRTLLAACIILAPLSITLYLVSWPGNLRQPLLASSMAGPIGNTLHFIRAIAASFFLPLGYLGMSLLGMRRAPWLATISAALSLVGWIPWAALMGLDDLAYDIDRGALTSQLAALWNHFNGDTVMTIYLLIYVIGHLVSAVLIGFMLGR